VLSLFAQSGHVPHVVEVTSPTTRGAFRQISRDGTVAFAQIHFDATRDQIKTATTNEIKSITTHARAPGFDAEFVGHHVPEPEAAGA